MGTPRARRPAADVEKVVLLADADTDADDGFKGHTSKRTYHHLLLLLPLLALGYGYINNWAFPFPSPEPLPPFVQDGIKKCAVIERPPPNPRDFDADRKRSDRFVKGTGAVWLKNGTVWTGEHHGEEVLYGADVWLEGGVVRKVGKGRDDFHELCREAGDADLAVEEVELNGAWVTPGIVDVHSHLAVDPAPGLVGSDSTNSLKNAILPYLRSLDGFNTHDAAFNLSIAGGITTMLVLPGSAGNIGGQAFTFKPRWTAENTPQSMQVEPPFVIDEEDGWVRTKAWRHIKHACGENPLRVYGNTRLDSAYDFRRAYTEGKKLKDKQERWCASPKSQSEPFPESLEWEVLADVIRGNVKVNIHCYETVDLNDLVRISNEFQFPIAAFHHAHEAYLVPDLLKQAWGPTPGVAIFANNARYKREAYRGTPYAPKILADAGLRVSMKSDHPVLDSRYLIFEAAQAHAFGLNFSEALSSVTTHPARTAGLGHRLGYVRPGYDADIVVWDSFPLAIGATPKQTYIDGIPQIIKPHVVHKPAAAQEISKEGNYDKEAAEAVESRGDPDLRPKKRSSRVVFDGVADLFVSLEGVRTAGAPSRVVVDDGEITCVGAECVVDQGEFTTVDLKGGSIAPGLISTGSKLGLIEIAQESSTSDGKAYDPLDSPDLLDGLLVRAADGARFGGKDELFAYEAGVTTGVTAPISNGFFAGYSYSFSTSAEHALEPGAIGNTAAALHLNLNIAKNSVSTKIALLRSLLAGDDLKASDELHTAFAKAAAGDLRLVVSTSSADHIAALIRVKRETAPALKLTILGGHESWLLADDLAKENVGVIIAPARSFPSDWNSRRVLPGPPLSAHTLPAHLASRGVTVGLGIAEECDARLTRFEAAWAYAAAPDVFSKQKALDLASGNLAELLGLDTDAKAADIGFVAYEGDVFSFESRVRAVRAPGRGDLDLFE
ncbi:hypothetical protein Q8F55_005608 [Vanrija albida]|uniref:Amidohydrolase-related domain-containing protein n=1 Tax=Vanrija albida TaxID=181172 RepID=A0ABR3Q240_9TREE